MREIRTSGLMNGEGKRSDANAVQTTAPFLDSTEAILYRWICDLLGGSEWRCVEVVFSVGTKWAGPRSWVRKWIGFVDFGYEGSFACWDVLAFFGNRNSIRWELGRPRSGSRQCLEGVCRLDAERHEVA